MAYRRSDADRVQADQARAAARAEVADLAAQGRERKAAAKAAQRAAAERDRLRQDRSKRRHLRAALLGSSGMYIAVVSACAVLGCGAGVLLMVLGGTPTTTGLGILIIVVNALAPWPLGIAMTDHLIGVEQRRIDALGFPLDGYLDALARDPTDGTLRLELTFVQDGPGREVADGLAATIGGTVVACAGRQLTLASAELSTDGGDGPATNALFTRWLRDVTGGLLPTLHEGYPIARAKVHRA